MSALEIKYLRSVRDFLLVEAKTNMRYTNVIVDIFRTESCYNR